MVMVEKIWKHGVAILTENGKIWVAKKIWLETVSIGKRVPVEGNQKGKAWVFVENGKEVPIRSSLRANFLEKAKANSYDFEAKS